MTPELFKPGWDTKISSIRCGILSYHRLASKTFGGNKLFDIANPIFLLKHTSGRRIDPVNTLADRARHDLIGTIRSSYAGVTLHAEPGVRAAV